MRLTKTKLFCCSIRKPNEANRQRSCLPLSPILQQGNSHYFSLGGELGVSLSISAFGFFFLASAFACTPTPAKPPPQPRYSGTQRNWMLISM